MLLREEHFFWGVIVFGLGATLGILVLDSDLNQPLLPMLSGLFGASSLLLSMREKQGTPKASLKRSCDLQRRSPILIFACVLAGFIAAFLPGLGSAQSAALARTTLWTLSDEETLILLGGINTVNFVLSLAAMLAIEKGRNGVVIALGEFMLLDTYAILLLACACLVAGSLAVICTLVLGRYGIVLLTKIPYKRLSLGVLIFVSVLVALISGQKGILVYLTAISIGLIAPLVRVPRSFAMGCLLVPVILFFLRLS
jgi:putative membrane protein